MQGAALMAGQVGNANCTTPAPSVPWYNAETACPKSWWFCSFNEVVTVGLSAAKICGADATASRFNCADAGGTAIGADRAWTNELTAGFPVCDGGAGTC